jgi:FKBP-type peptidyl-prolyl cis-trans isomerase
VSFRLARTSSGRRIAASIALLFAAACGDEGLSTAPGSGLPSNPATETFAASLGVNLAAMTKKSDNLYVQDIVVGGGATAANGSILRVTYTGYLVNGTKFDSNVGGTTFAFRLGLGDVIGGWDQGLVGMKVGGKRKLVIGSTLGYGARGSGPIPGNATLVFDVELVSVS